MCLSAERSNSFYSFISSVSKSHANAHIAVNRYPKVLVCKLGLDYKISTTLIDDREDVFLGKHHNVCFAEGQ